MDEDQGRSVVLRAGSFVKHPAMFPTKEVGLAAKGTVVGLVRIASNRRVEGGQRRYPGATGKHRLPDVSQFAHRKPLSR